MEQAPVSKMLRKEHFKGSSTVENVRGNKLPIVDRRKRKQQEGAHSDDTVGRETERREGYQIAFTSFLVNIINKCVTFQLTRHTVFNHTFRQELR